MIQINYKLLSLALVMLIVVILFQCSDKSDHPKDEIALSENVEDLHPASDVRNDSDAGNGMSMEDVQADLEETFSKLDKTIIKIKQFNQDSIGNAQGEMEKMIKELEYEKEKLVRRQEILQYTEEENRAEVINNIEGALKNVQDKIDVALDLVDNGEESL